MLDTFFITKDLLEQKEMDFVKDNFSKVSNENYIHKELKQKLKCLLNKKFKLASEMVLFLVRNKIKVNAKFESLIYALYKYHKFIYGVYSNDCGIYMIKEKIDTYKDISNFIYRLSYFGSDIKPFVVMVGANKIRLVKDYLEKHYDKDFKYKCKTTNASTKITASDDNERTMINILQKISKQLDVMNRELHTVYLKVSRS